MIILSLYIYKQFRLKFLITASIYDNFYLRIPLEEVRWIKTRTIILLTMLTSVYSDANCFKVEIDWLSSNGAVLSSSY